MYLLLALAVSPALQDLNRLQLDNGPDVLWLINAPFDGVPVDSFDETGDMYWKVFPAEALRRNDGTAPLMGLGLSVFDTDFASTEALWAYTLNTGTVGTDGGIVPVFPPHVFVPGTSTHGTIFGSPSGGSPPPGYVSGWVYTETFLNTTGSTTALIDLTADGTVDWVFTHYFPDVSPFVPGDITMQWAGSSDLQPFPALARGENQPDWTGLGISTYSGFNIGGAGVFAPISEWIDDAPNVGFYFDQPTLTPWFDTGDGFGEEMGMAALRFPVGARDADPRLGIRIYDNDPGDGTKVGFAFANIRPSLLASRGAVLPFLGTTLALNPTDPLFFASAQAWGRGPLVVTPAPPLLLNTFGGATEERAFTSKLFALSQGPLLDGATLEIQGFTLELGSSTAEVTNLFEMHLHASADR